MPENKNVVGEQVRVVRNQRGWSQADFAAKCQLIGWDIDRGTVSKIEAGQRRVTDAELYMLAATLKVPIPDLFPAEKDVRRGLRN